MIARMAADASPAGPARLDRAWAIVFARLVLGFIFFMAGVYKVFEQGPLEHARKWFLPFHDTFLPVWSLWAVGTVVPFIELVAGGLVLVGWCVREALIALGGVLVIVTFGHLLHEPLHPFHEHVIPRLALLIFVLAMPRDDDRFSVDHLLGRRSRRVARGAH
jgi:uncharacterized membrane protein YphA (DoxX/SURF4 family)